MKFFFILLIIPNVLGARYAADEFIPFCDSHPSDNWTCNREEDGSLTITFDCNQNEEIVWLWSTKFPDDMKTLIIQNCKKLDIYTEHVTFRYHAPGKKNDPANDFQVLQVLNVSDLYVTKKNLVEEERQGDHYYYQQYYDEKSCLPAKTIFENVKNALFDTWIVEPRSCSKYNLTSLKLINVSFSHFGSFFRTDDYSRSVQIEEFVMDTVNIGNIKRNAITIENKEAFITIKNSIIESADNTFINCNGHEVKITNNSFKHLYGTESFILKADRIVFEGNDVPAGDNIFTFTAADIKITDNIFHHVYENAFSNINSSITAIQKNISSSYNFSNNIIHSVEPGAFDFNPKNPRQTLFDQIIISNNSINCACRNMYWFHSVAEKNSDFQKNHLRSKWVQRKNDNKCSNIPNCTVSQVLKNYHDLCDDDFDCSERSVNSTIENNCTENNNREENLLENFLNYNNEMGERNSRLLQVLIKNMEENNIFGDLNETERNLPPFDGSLVAEDFQEDSLNHFSYDVKVSKICLFALTSLFCIVIFSVMIMKILKFGIVKFFSGRKNLVIETEMNQSSVTELCTELD